MNELTHNQPLGCILSTCSFRFTNKKGKIFFCKYSELLTITNLIISYYLDYSSFENNFLFVKMGNHINSEQRSQSHTSFLNNAAQPNKEVDENPQQNLFTFDELSLDSRFECGNLMYADKVAPGQYNIWIAPDCYKTPFETKQRVAFYFKVANVNLQGFPSRKISFRIMNVSKVQDKNYKEGMVPVYLSVNNKNSWQILPSPLTDFKLTSHKTIEIAFDYTFNLADSLKGVFFAFTFPYTYTDNNNFVTHLENTYARSQSIYFHRELLTHSPEGRRIDLLTITAHDADSLNPGPPYLIEPFLPELFPTHVRKLTGPPSLETRNIHRPFVFRNKGYILISARVHAAESPANFMLQSFLLSLLRENDPVSQLLLQNFVFVVIPMLNPDGVVRGHYRSDLKGRDMNRSYSDAPNLPQDLPGPYSVLEVAKSLARDKKLVMYVDLHAHSNMDSGFILAPHHGDPAIMAELRLFARVFDIYSPSFDFNCCEFGEENDSKAKAGLAKNAIRNATGIVHSYTFEAAYNRTTKDPFRYSPQHNVTQDLKKSVPRKMTVLDFMELGENMRNPMLETLVRSHPVSLLPKTWFGDVNNLYNIIHQNQLKGGVQAPTEKKPVND